MVRLPLTPADVERGRRLGAALRAARGSRSILEVALAARLSPETVRKIESGRVATPAFSTVAAVATVVELSLDDLWELMQSREPERDQHAPAQATPQAALEAS
ncbi:helix-turn-helix domain-containing protein [Cellulomonas marina]|uniref:helix-turn-helix domain-containing protein n=1 Tax=Cellulomonas marina TaxID=988821 RepID=UPI000B7E6B40|nr:helix-turn-helix transcriptional regulator [Cellulomonas marina]